MTKEEFRKMELACKREWKDLAESGDSEKSDIICDSFISGCPACEIASITCAIEDLNTFKKCRFCPITLWRFLTPEGATCQDVLEDNFYDQWIKAETRIERMQLAEVISNLPWEWMDEYEKVELNQKVKDYLNSMEE